MILKILAFTALLAVAYGGGHTHIAHSTVIKHEVPQKAEYHHHEQSGYGGHHESQGHAVSSQNIIRHDNNGHNQVFHQEDNYNDGSYSGDSGSSLIDYHKESSLSDNNSQGHGHAFSSQSIVFHPTGHAHPERQSQTNFAHGQEELNHAGYHYAKPSNGRSYELKKSGFEQKQHASSYNQGQEQSLGHAYSSQSIIHHKIEHQASSKESESSLLSSHGSSSVNNHDSNQGSSYDSGLGLGHYASSLQQDSHDYSKAYSHGQKSASDNGINLDHFSFGQEHKDSQHQSLPSQSHGHSISIVHESGHGKKDDGHQHIESYNSQASSGSQGYVAASENQIQDHGYVNSYHQDKSLGHESQSGNSHGHSISIHHDGGHAHSLGKTSSLSSSDSYGNVESSQHLNQNHGHEDYYHHEALSGQNAHSGKSHGHSISIHHEIGKGQGLGDSSSQSSSGYNGQTKASESESGNGYSLGGSSVLSSSRSYGHSEDSENESQHNGYENDYQHEGSYGLQSQSGKSHGHSISIYHEGGHNRDLGSLSSSSSSGSYGKTESSSNSNQDSGNEDYYYHDSSSGQQSQSGKSHGHSVSIKHERGNGYNTEGSSIQSSPGFYGYAKESESEIQQNKYENDYRYKESSGYQSSSGKSHGHSIYIQHESGKGHSQGHGHLGASSSQSSSGYYGLGQVKASEIESDSSYNLGVSSVLSSSGVYGHSEASKSENEQKVYENAYHHDASSSLKSQSGKSHGHSISIQHVGGHSHSLGGSSSQSSASHGLSSLNLIQSLGGQGHGHYDVHESNSLGSSGSSAGHNGYQSSLIGGQSSNKGQEQYHVEHYIYPKYDYHYEVQDKRTGDVKAHHEHRDGNAVKGEYSLQEPNGSIKQIEYQSKKYSSSNAEENISGKSSHEFKIYHR